MNFQGRLTDAAGMAVPNGVYNMRFRVYTAASGGTQLWAETRETTNRISVTDGLFSAQLGSVTPLTASVFNNAATLYFEVELPTPATATCATASCQTWTEGALSPRSVIAASAYAMNAATLDGIAAGGFIQNQSGSAQSASSFWLSGTGRADTTFLAPRLDTATAGTLTLGDTNATGLTLGKTGVTTTAGGALTANGLLSGNAGATVSGPVTLNTSGANAVNINTGSATGATTIGNSAAGTILVQSASAVGITGTTTVQGLNSGSGVALTVSNATSTGIILELKDNATTVMSVADGGALLAKNSVNTSAGFTIQNATGYSLFTADTINSRLVLGTPGGDATGTLLVLGNKTTAGDPTGVEGAMYYNGAAKSFRCYSDGAWSNCASPGLDPARSAYAEDFPVTGSSNLCSPIMTTWVCATDGSTNTAMPLTDETNHPGMFSMSPGSTTSGMAGNLYNTQSLNITYLNKAIFYIKTDTSLAKYTGLRVGLFDSTYTGASYGSVTGGYYFEYISGSYWRVVTRKNATPTETSTLTSYTIAANTWYKLEIRKTTGGFDFYIDDTYVGASDPVNASSVTTQKLAFGVKNASSGQAKVTIDYAGHEIKLAR